MSKRNMLLWLWPFFVFACGPMVFFACQVGNSFKEGVFHFIMFWPWYMLLLKNMYHPSVFLIFVPLAAALVWWFKKPGIRSGAALMIACNIILGLPGYYWLFVLLEG